MSKFSLNEVSELLQIPKSTLRYWEKEKLIHSQRNPDNDYRSYTVDDMVVIIDIMFYRNLNVSVDTLKNLYGLSIDQHISLLQNNEQEINKKIQQLLTIKKKYSKKSL